MKLIIYKTYLYLVFLFCLQNFSKQWFDGLGQPSSESGSKPPQKISEGHCEMEASRKIRVEAVLRELCLISYQYIGESIQGSNLSLGIEPWPSRMALGTLRASLSGWLGVCQLHLQLGFVPASAWVHSPLICQWWVTVFGYWGSLSFATHLFVSGSWDNSLS